MSNDPAERALADFRKRIDECDLAILAGLRERARAVALVGADKRARGVADIYRPGREAALMRRLAAADSAPFPAASLFGVWREVIGASFAIEGHPLHVASAGAGAWERARSHFRAARHSRAAGARAALEAVAAGDATLAVVGLDDDEPWWPMLAEETLAPLHIVARLPFAPEPWPVAGADALAIARTRPDPSGDDLTVAIAEAPAGEVLAAAGGRYLVALASPGDAMVPVGGYATPLSLEEIVR